MKKLIFALLCVMSTQFANAQFEFGVKGGVNLNKIKTDAGTLGDNINESLDSRVGFNAGIFARIGNTFYIQPEVIYAERNGRINVNEQSQSVNIKNVDVPVLLGFRPLNFLRINAGPVATVRLSDNINFKNVGSNIPDGDAIKNATFGYQLGAGLTFGAIDIDVRKEGSLGSISSNMFQDQKFNQKTDGWLLTVGLKIF